MVASPEAPPALQGALPSIPHRSDSASLRGATSLRVAVIGGGYVGLVSAACLAELGHQVTVVETNPDRMRMLQASVSPIHEAGLQELLEAQSGLGRLEFTVAHAAAVESADVVMVAVGTPTLPGGGVDLRAVEAVVTSTAQYASDALIVIKSTVPPGTSTRMESLAHSLGATGVRVVSNPEFLREGSAVADFRQPDRVVIGACDDRDAAVVELLYQGIDAPVLRCAPEEAELAKYASNALLAARISFMNEVAVIADGVGADVTRVAQIVGADRRIGPAFLAAGLGWGGSCFPKDVRGLAATASELGIETPMLRATIEANEAARERALQLVLESLGRTRFPRVAVFGLAFKPGTDDLRDSPALWLASALADRGVEVRATDPQALAGAEGADARLFLTLDVLAAVHGADALVLATEWPEYRSLDWTAIARRMCGQMVLDARNVLDAHEVTRAGLRYRSLGRDIAGRFAERTNCTC